LLSYPQNIRNNKTHRRTPKWAQRYGLVDTAELKRKERKSQWAARYNERTTRSALEDQAYEEGQNASNGPDDLGSGRVQRPAPTGELWNPTEEQFYGQRDDSSSSHGNSAGRWHYPANFDDADPGTPIDSGRKKKKKDGKKDRWARTEDAYAQQEASASSKRRKSKRSKSSRSAANEDTYSARSGSTTNFPEDAEGGLYGNSEPRRAEQAPPARRTEAQEFDHQF
jgi:hypothetical protein